MNRSQVQRVPGLPTGAKVPGPDSTSALPLLLSQGCAASLDLSASPPLASLPPPSTHPHPLAPHSPPRCRPPGPPPAMRAAWGSSSVKVRVPSMLALGDGTIPFPELRPIPCRVLGCAVSSRPGKIFVLRLCAAGGGYRIPSHLTAGQLSELSPPASWAGLSASSQTLQTSLYHRVG